MSFETELTKEIETMDKLKDFLNFTPSFFKSECLTDKVKEMCVAKLCDAIGIRCEYNYKNIFFDFFSSIMGQAISEKLNLNLCLDDYNLRFVKFESVNLIKSAGVILDCKEIDEAFIDVYELADKFKWVMRELKKV